MINFMSPYLLGLIPIVLLVLFFASRRRKSYGHTQVETQKNLRSMYLVSRLPMIFLSGFLICLCLAIARPVVPESHTTQSIDTRDFCIAVDVSGSMDAEISDPNQKALVGDPNKPQVDADGKPIKTTRITVAKASIAQFIPTRKGDRMCYIQFDDEAYFSWPLTTDLELIAKRNTRLGKYSGGGTNFDGPDEGGYQKTGPIQAAIDHFDELGEARTKVLIMVTDGEASIKPERKQQLLELLKKGNIRIYVLGIAEGWVQNSSSVQDLKAIAEESGGKVMPVGDATAMTAGFDEINKLEKTSVKVEKAITYRDVFEYFVFAALALAFAFCVTATLVREDV